MKTNARNLVVYSLEPWDEIWRRNQFLVSGLLRTDPSLRVLFVEPPADPLYELTNRRAPRTGTRLSEIVGVDGVGAGRLWRYQPTKWLPRVVGKSDLLTARAIRRVVGRLGFDDPILWANDPAAATLLARSGWRGLYDMTDDWVAATRTQRQHRRVREDEATLMRLCHTITVCSTGLAATKGQIRDVVLIQNAVDVTRFRQPTSRPSDLPAGLVALYAGTVHTDRFNVDLAVATARKLGAIDAKFVLVGPMLLSDSDQARIIDAGGVIAGGRRYEEIPAYLQHADVLLVPHVVDEFTDSLDPIKLYEYRAVGRPVVTTPVAGFREIDDPRVIVADPQSFPDAVVAQIAGTQKHGTPQVDDIPTWDDRVTQMADVLEHLSERRGI